jgi:hypothetical protein
MNESLFAHIQAAMAEPEPTEIVDPLPPIPRDWEEIRNRLGGYALAMPSEWTERREGWRDRDVGKSERLRRSSSSASRVAKAAARAIAHPMSFIRTPGYSGFVGEIRWAGPRIARPYRRGFRRRSYRISQ